MATILKNKEMQTIITVIFDSGDGDNLVREDVLLALWLVVVQPIRTSLRDTGDKEYRIEGVIRVSVQLSEHKAKAGIQFWSRTKAGGQNIPRHRVYQEGNRQNWNEKLIIYTTDWARSRHRGKLWRRERRTVPRRFCDGACSYERVKCSSMLGGNSKDNATK